MLLTIAPSAMRMVNVQYDILVVFGLLFLGHIGGCVLPALTKGRRETKLVCDADGSLTGLILIEIFKMK